MSNLFAKSEVKEVAKANPEIATAINKNEKKGKTMSKITDAVFADNPKDKADTLFKLSKRIDAKIKFLDDMEDSMGAELFMYERKARSIDLTDTVIKVPTLVWDSDTKTESTVNKEWNAMERKLFLEKAIRSIGAEKSRLQIAKTAVYKAADEPDATGYELFYLKPAVVKNDEAESNYPSQNFKQIDNSLSLMKSVAFEIRNVILERKKADLYTKKNAGYFQRDARDLRTAVNESKKKLKKAEWKLEYLLSR